MGLEITAFTVVNISFPETVEKALDERTSLGILSDKMGVYAQKKAADALGEAAKNQGGTGTVIGMGLGSFVNGQMGAMMNNVQQTEQKKSDDEKIQRMWVIMAIKAANLTPQDLPQKKDSKADKADAKQVAANA